MRNSHWLWLFLTLGCGASQANEGPVAARSQALTSVENAEIKVTVRADQIAMATRRFSLVKRSAEHRFVSFYDTRSLELFGGGLILRSRKVQDGKDNSTAKLRPIDPTRVAASWFGKSGFKCEEDWVGGTAVAACSFSNDQGKGEIDDVAVGKRAIEKLYSSDQERFVSTYASRAPDYAKLSVLGPVDAWVWEMRVPGFAEKLTVERWELPDSTAILELSIRIPIATAVAAQRAFLSYLESNGFDTRSREDSKTRAALEYFSRH